VKIDPFPSSSSRTWQGMGGVMGTGSGAQVAAELEKKGVPFRF